MDDEHSFDRKVRGKTYKRRDEAGNEVSGLNLGAPGRLKERRRRCQNCQWFDVETNFEAHVNACTIRDANILRGKGASHGVVAAHTAKIRRTIQENRGLVGYCMKRIVRRDRAAGDDFTSAGYLCDQWSGAYGLKFGPADGPVDKLPEELLDDMGESLPATPREEEVATPDGAIATSPSSSGPAEVATGRPATSIATSIATSAPDSGRSDPEGDQ